jgi:hypothetical protein
MMRVPHPNATVQADARVDHCSLVIARQRYLDALYLSWSQLGPSAGAFRDS